MAVNKKSQRSWPWCLASNRRLNEFPEWSLPISEGGDRYRCPDCGRVVGIRHYGDGQALARHYKTGE